FADAVDDRSRGEEFTLVIGSTPRRALDGTVDAAFRKRAFDARLVVVLVVTEHDDVGVDALDRHEDVFGVAEDRTVDGIECVDHLPALAVGEYGLLFVSGVLAAADDHDEFVSHCRRLFEILEMAGMEDVEGALCDDGPRHRSSSSMSACVKSKKSSSSGSATSSTGRSRSSPFRSKARQSSGRY